MKLLWVVRLLGALSMLVLPYTGFSYHPTSTSVGGISIADAAIDGDHIGDLHDHVPVG
jgi:hypothetical protein